MNFNNAYMQDGQFLLKLTLEMTNYFAHKQDHAMKEKQSNTLHHHSLFLKTSLELTRPVTFQVLQNQRFSTDRDDTMTRHDFRPWFICLLNSKSLAQFLYTKLACTMYLTLGENVKTDKCSRIDNFQPIQNKP